MADNFAKHHGQHRDEQLFHHVPKRSTQAHPRQPQSIKNRKRRQTNLEERFRLSSQRLFPREPNGASRQNSRHIQNRSDHLRA